LADSGAFLPPLEDVDERERLRAGVLKSPGGGVVPDHHLRHAIVDHAVERRGASAPDRGPDRA
jgi:hypothetical protein